MKVKLIKNKILLCMLIAFLCVLFPTVLCGCEKLEETITTGEVLDVLDGVDLCSQNFSATINFQNSAYKRVEVEYIKSNSDEKFAVKKINASDVVAENQTIYKIGSLFYLYNAVTDKMVEITSYEYDALKSEFITLLYDKDYMIRNDAFAQMQIYDFYGFTESLSLVSGKKKDKATTINLSCPLLDADVLYYIDSKVVINGDRVQSIDVYKNAEKIYLSAGVREEMVEKTEGKVVTFTYSGLSEFVQLPKNAECGEGVARNIVYDVSPYSVDGKFCIVQSKEYATMLKLMQAPNIAGFNFKGWFFDDRRLKIAGNGGDDIQFPKNGDLVLYARYAKAENAKKLTINIGNATCTQESAKAVYFGSGESFESVVNRIGLNWFYLSEHYLEGFYKDAGFTQPVDDEILQEDATVYVKFKKYPQIFVDSSKISNQAFRKYYVYKDSLYVDAIKPYKSKDEPFVDYYLDKDFKTPLSSLTNNQIAERGSVTVYPKFASKK